MLLSFRTEGGDRRWFDMLGAPWYSGIRSPRFVIETGRRVFGFRADVEEAKSIIDCTGIQYQLISKRGCWSFLNLPGIRSGARRSPSIRSAKVRRRKHEFITYTGYLEGEKFSGLLL
jgi:hypothetical protein